MPDKRDMHKAKSHRNSKAAKQQQQASERRADANQTTTMTSLDEPIETTAPDMRPDMRGKKNKSRR